MAFKRTFQGHLLTNDYVFERAEISCDRKRYLFGRPRLKWGRLQDGSLNDESKGRKRAGLARKIRWGQRQDPPPLIVPCKLSIALLND
jgi:hypothetical protein